MARANPGRCAAVRALVAIETGQFAEDALAQTLPKEGRDRELGWFLAMGVLRHRNQVDAAIRPFLRQPLGGLEAPVRGVLRVGAFEKLFARTKPHAVVSQGVEVARKVGAGRASGLVNAVLRKVKAPEKMSRIDRLDHPAWLVSRWDRRYGEEATDAWCLANGELPPLVIISNSDEVLSTWSEAGLTAEPVKIAGKVVQNAWCIEGHKGPIPNLPGWDNARLWVQDAAAVAVAGLCGDVDGKRVLDACAAPGGKSFRIASRGGQVLAVDRDDGRLDRVRESASRLKFEIVCRVHDWSDGAMEGTELFDVVLVDAPCSGIGTLRRRPEIRWRRHAHDLIKAAARQSDVLNNASVHVAVGGTLVYAVCSPEPEEGTEVVDAFLKIFPNFKRVHKLDTAPPQTGEDAHQGFVLQRVS
ncbi:MAG: hypothetical protein GWP91_01880, partial [Rhodobacterales bacterium]|nr:hypothetical protein [Rhodobacterales bacterium]